ncbi:MAG: hypothetical protein AAFS10_11800 [Myxococcota bacterium]
MRVSQRLLLLVGVTLVLACPSTSTPVQPDPTLDQPNTPPTPVPYTIQWVLSDLMYQPDDGAYISSVALHVKGPDVDTTLDAGIESMGCSPIEPTRANALAMVRCFFAGAGHEVSAMLVKTDAGKMLKLMVVAREETTDPVSSEAARLKLPPGVTFTRLKPIARSMEPDGVDQSAMVAVIGTAKALELRVSNPSELAPVTETKKPITCTWSVSTADGQLQATTVVRHKQGANTTAEFCMASFPRPVARGAKQQPFRGKGVTWPLKGTPPPTVTATVTVESGSETWTHTSGVTLPERLIDPAKLRNKLRDKNWTLITATDSTPEVVNGVLTHTWLMHSGVAPKRARHLPAADGPSLTIAVQIGTVALDRCRCDLDGLRVGCQACSGNLRLDLLGGAHFDDREQLHKAIDADQRALLLSAYKVLNETM